MHKHPAFLVQWPRAQVSQEHGLWLESDAESRGIPELVLAPAQAWVVHCGFLVPSTPGVAKATCGLLGVPSTSESRRQGGQNWVLSQSYYAVKRLKDDDGII